MINCIPGTFTAFRREPACFVGGFVSGMNGEDSDLTMLIGRLGYQVAVDTRIRIYEDVPENLRGFREQRVRWNRAGVHILSRHSPFLAGGGCPRSWFFTVRAATVRVTAVLRPIVFITGLELSLLNPQTRAVAPRVLVFYFVAGIPTVLVIVALAIRHGFRAGLAGSPFGSRLHLCAVSSRSKGCSPFRRAQRRASERNVASPEPLLRYRRPRGRVRPDDITQRAT